MPIQLALLNELMGLPPNASEHGILIDHLLEFCHWFMLILFVGWTAYFFYTLFRYHHSRNPKANYYGVKSKASAHLEFIVVLVEAVLLLGFAVPLWGSRVTEFPNEQELRVRAIGEQFAWYFHYPGADGVFGRSSVEFVSPSNPLGLDPEDPASSDDFYSKNELHLVNHRPTVIEVTSKDVIHSLSLQHMRMDQDALPGSRIPMWFRPIRAGQYEIVCAQLCGAGHYGMKAQMYVEDAAKFADFEKETVTLQHPAGATKAAPAGASQNPGTVPSPGGSPSPAAH